MVWQRPFQTQSCEWGVTSRTITERVLHFMFEWWIFSKGNIFFRSHSFSFFFQALWKGWVPLTDFLFSSKHLQHILHVRRAPFVRSGLGLGFFFAEVWVWNLSPSQLEMAKKHLAVLQRDCHSHKKASHHVCYEGSYALHPQHKGIGPCHPTIQTMLFKLPLNLKKVSLPELWPPRVW